MTRVLYLFAAIVAALASCAQSPPPADLVLLGGVVHTLDQAAPRAQAVAARDGAIVYVGSDDGARAYLGPKTRAVELEGRTVVPGFADSHAHLSGIGAREMTLNLEGTASLAELLDRVAEQVRRAEPGEWIVGRGWIEARWDPPVFPTRYDLDKVSPENPVSLVRADGHGAVANSAALGLGGIDRDTAAPEGGEIMRDPKTGEPTGMLLDRAQQLVRRRIPPESPERRRRALLVGARRSAEMGWTQLSIAGNSYAEIAMLRELLGAGEIPIRIYDAVRGPGADADRLLAEGPRSDDAMLVVRGIKLTMDGALGSQGAALLEPYADHAGRGLLMHDERELRPLLERALRAGIQVQTHAIGDRANRITLDLYAAAFKSVPVAERKIAEPRWRIEHAQILDPSDIGRFARLGVIASMQPSHAITDLFFAKSRLGAARLAGAYAWRSLVDSGAVVAGGSDAPVEKGDPVVEFYAAAVRKSVDGKSGEHWHREQRLTREEALKTLTSWAAYATFQELERGTIEVGKRADLTVLSRDVLTVPEEEILKTKCVMTIVAGSVVFER